MDYTAEENISEMKGRIDSWFPKFLHVYQGQDACVFRNHVPEFPRLYQNIEYFTQQDTGKCSVKACGARLGASLELRRHTTLDTVIQYNEWGQNDRDEVTILSIHAIHPSCNRQPGSICHFD